LGPTFNRMVESTRMEENCIRFRQLKSFFYQEKPC
jgi:hypothetical protein